MSLSNRSTADGHPVSSISINPAVSEFFLTFNLIICGGLIGCCGILGNVINIVNFKKQGLRDSVNVTLTALAVSDFGALVCQVILNIIFSPFWKRVELPFTSTSVLAMLFFYPHGYFIRVSGFVTAFAAFERCLCVVLPLKVRSVITRNVSIAVNSLIFIVLLLYLFPANYVSYPDRVFIPIRNRTVLTILYRENAEYVLRITNIVNDLFVPYVTFFVLILCTVIIVIKLKTNSKWRRSVTISSMSAGLLGGTGLSRRDKKAVVMLTVVSVIFVACLTPECALMSVLGFIQDLKVEGPLWDVSLLMYCFTSLLETVNCSVSAIVYYKMSSRYREIIQTWFPKWFPIWFLTYYSCKKI